MKLQGKVALVTGGSRGIGRSIIETFAHHGASVIINYCHAEKEARTLAASLESTYDARTLVVRADVSDAEQVQIMMEQIADQYERLDILINNAGILFPGKLFDLTEQQWDRVMAVNLKGAFLCSRAASTMMMKQGGGTIISLASFRGLVGGGSSLAYDVSKAGVVILTRSLAAELAPLIRVNCIAPGYIVTDILEQKPEKEREELRKKILLKREGTSDEVARAALFLASDDATYITGATLDLSGGLLMH